MDTALWVIQGVLGFMFLAAGLMKATQPIDKLAAKMSWVEDSAPGTVRFIGYAEIAGAIGLVVPWATGILPVLTPVAASALGVVMVLAAQVHAKHKEYGYIGVNAALLGAAVFVALGRFGVIA